MAFSVRSIKVGECQVPGPEVFWMSSWDKWVPLAMQVVLVQGNGVTALVNSGLPSDLEEINSVWRTGEHGERTQLKRLPEEEITAALAIHGLEPADVTHLILTPLQVYTTANVPLFDQAQICISRRGWVHFHTTHRHPHDDRWMSIQRPVLVHLVTDAWDRVRLLNDEDEVVPGIRTWFSGVHHRASICVEVDSTSGVVAISDSFFKYGNVEHDRILGISESVEEALTTYPRVRSSALHIVPLYDPEVFQRYPGGLVAP